jgi:hypothetical protein
MRFDNMARLVIVTGITLMDVYTGYISGSEVNLTVRVQDRRRLTDRFSNGCFMLNIVKVERNNVHHHYLINIDRAFLQEK